MVYTVVQAFWYFDTQTGEYHYRIDSPGKMLNDHDDFQVIDMHIFHPLFPQLALEADLLILHLLPDDEIGQVIRLRSQMGKATVFEIADNFLELGSWMDADDGHRNTTLRGNFLNYARSCQGLQFSSDDLVRVFGFVNPNHKVFHNQAGFFSRQDPADEPFIFGWGGSKGHREDLMAIAPVIKAFCQRHEDVVFSYMGWPPMFEEIFADLPPGRWKMREAGPIEEWFTFLQGLHVGLAPLADTAFNRARSDVKFLEYAAHHVVPVISDAAPYRVHARDGQNALVFKNLEELGLLLERLHADPDYRRRMGDQAYAYACNHRDRKKHLTARIDFYRHLLPAKPTGQATPEIPACKGLIAYLRKASQRFDEARYEETLQTLDDVLAQFPSFQAAHLLRAKTLLRMGLFQDVLRGYAEFAVEPMYADLFYETIALAAKRENMSGWRGIVEHMSDPLVKLRTAPLANRVNHYRAVLEHNPFDYDSLIGLAENLAENQPEEARLLYERAAFLHPENTELAALVKK